jgi:UDP-N-acetylglucosamine--N-acetylmuramyl-(pentapeptide) pyrophosphoryl-undecaprenol N-acetylglucosamine transferase
VSHTGNPVRQAVLDRASAPYIPPGDYPMNDAGDRRQSGRARLVGHRARGRGAAAGSLRARLHVAHQARAEDGTTASSKPMPMPAIRADVQPFFADVPQRLPRTASW